MHLSVTTSQHSNQENYIQADLFIGILIHHLILFIEKFPSETLSFQLLKKSFLFLFLVLNLDYFC